MEIKQYTLRFRGRKQAVGRSPLKVLKESRGSEVKMKGRLRTIYEKPAQLD